MKPIKLFEELASDTWERIKEGNKFGISQGEETITDINLLKIHQSQYPNIRVIKTPKVEESQNGTDWEWWVGTGSKWLRFAIQAKKGYPPAGRYPGINKKVDDTPQIEILENYAKGNKAIPLYCFYNADCKVDPTRHWHCDFDFDPPQLGCSLTSLPVVKASILKRGGKNFDYIHSHSETIPWRCLFKWVLTSLGTLNKSTEGKHGLFSYLNKIEPTIYRSPPEGIDNDELYSFQESTYNTDLVLFPKRILVIDVSEQNN
jgi:hypothetical protein